MLMQYKLCVTLCMPSASSRWCRCCLQLPACFAFLVIPPLHHVAKLEVAMRSKARLGVCCAQRWHLASSSTDGCRYSSMPTAQLLACVLQLASCKLLVLLFSYTCIPSNNRTSGS